jgi:hypothetical protein
MPQWPWKKGDQSQPEEVNPGGKKEGTSASADILRITTQQEAGAQTTPENVSGHIVRTGDGTNILRNLAERSRISEAGVEEPSRGPETHTVASDSGDPRLDKTFKNYTALYEYGYNIARKDLRKRLEENPHPTSLERNMGIFLEDLSPQFRDAVPLMNTKGYETWSAEARLSSESFNWSAEAGPFDEDFNRPAESSSRPQAVPEGMQERVMEDTPNIPLEGEAKNHYRTQQIDGKFTLDEATIGKLKGIGVHVEATGNGDKTYTRIFFDAPEANLKTIKELCGQIAAILPDKGQPAPPNMSQNAVNFRARYSQDTNVASRSVPGAISIPGRSAQDTYRTSREASSHSSSPETSSMELEDIG